MLHGENGLDRAMDISKENVNKDAKKASPPEPLRLDMPMSSKQRALIGDQQLQEPPDAMPIKPNEPVRLN